MTNTGVDGNAARAAPAPARAIGACRICREAAVGTPLPHEPRPVLRPSPTARLVSASQAPGVRVHASGVPFSDPPGDRLRAWLALTPEEFYDAAARRHRARWVFAFPATMRRRRPAAAARVRTDLASALCSLRCRN